MRTTLPAALSAFHVAGTRLVSSPGVFSVLGEGCLDCAVLVSGPSHNSGIRGIRALFGSTDWLLHGWLG